MITFFTTAKSFLGEARQRQLNALRSWQCIHPEVEVILCGEGDGYREVVSELGLIWLPDVACSEEGCPRIDDMIRKVRGVARHKILAYLNCDIIVMPDLLEAVQRIPFSRFLMVTQRWDTELTNAIDFGNSGYEQVRQIVEARGVLSRITAIDMLLFRGNVWQELPPLYVGRAYYDNYLLFRALAANVPLVDATKCIMLVHQNHGYGHIAGGIDAVWDGNEGLHNLDTVGGYEALCSIEDATWELTPDALRRNFCRGDALRYAQVRRLVWRANDRIGSRLPQIVAEMIAEWQARFYDARRGSGMPLAKYPLWLTRRAIHGKTRAI